MTRKMKPEAAEGTNVHLHHDLQVTRARLESFASADVDVQLGVLASLRATAHDSEATQVLALQSMGVAVLAVFLTAVPGIVPRLPAMNSGSSWWTDVINVAARVLVIVVFAVLVIIPVLRDQSRLNRNRQLAVVWLGAYEDELNRLRSASGRAARRWRREHPL
jgi:hypothetical protein